MSDAIPLAVAALVVVLQFAVPALLSRWLPGREVSPGVLWLLFLGPGALIGLGVGTQDHQYGPDLFAGMVMALPGALIALGSHRWCRNKPNGQAAFAAFLWWTVATTWFLAAGGFVLLGFLAKAFGNTGHDGVLGTALKIGALGGGFCGLVTGGPLGLLRMLMLAKRQPSS